jgi:2-phospho-L-lactate guanylyltransferase
VRTLAIVPVKSFDEAKQRLGAQLARGSRSSLAQAMFSDVLAGLGRVRSIDAIAVVTADSAAQQLAHGRALVLHDSAQAGQSDAVQIGIRHAVATGYPRALLVPGDTPLIDPAEVEALLESSERERLGVAIVSDRHGTGTNALVLSPPDAIAPAFGPESLWRHVGLAKAAGVEHRVVPAPSLEHDVDTPEDLAALREAIAGVRGRGQRTWGALHQIDHSRAQPAIREHAPVEVQA